MTRVSWFPLSLARLGLAAALLAFSAGCVSSRAFVPGEHLTGFSPDGAQPAAEYALLEDGEALGDVKVWSSGAVRDGSRTQVHVAFEITNQSRAPLRFDARQLFLEELPEKGKPPGRPPGRRYFHCTPPLRITILTNCLHGQSTREGYSCEAKSGSPPRSSR